MSRLKSKLLILSGQSPVNAGLVRNLKDTADVVEAATIDQAIDALRQEHFDAVFADAADFLPLERALVSQQASVILSTIGEGVCIVDGDARCNWMNKKMKAWPPGVHEKIRRACQEAFAQFTAEAASAAPDAPISMNRAKRHSLNVDDSYFLEMTTSPVVAPAGQVVQVVAVVWDATPARRMQQKIDAIDNAGRALVRLESEAMSKLNVGQRLQVLQDKIVAFVRDLMHFDHFAIRLLDRKTNKLEPVICLGLPREAMDVELYAESEGHGISGYVAATGRSYICPDVQRDARYVKGLEGARSSLTVPMLLHEKVIGIFNIESRQKGAFSEDDRQFAEIFGRYVAIALNILDLLVGERVITRHDVTDDVASELAGPLNDIASDATALTEDYIGNDELRGKLRQITENVVAIRARLRQAAEGPRAVLGAGEVRSEADPVISASRVLVADDEPNLRSTIHDVLCKHGAVVTVVASGAEAIGLLERQDFDLVVSDIKMPDKSGYEVFAAARRRSQTLPVILMTGFGYDPSHTIVRASQEGLQAVLFKPFKVSQLIAEVRRALQPLHAAR